MCFNFHTLRSTKKIIVYFINTAHFNICSCNIELLARLAIGSQTRCIIDLGIMADKIIPVVKADEGEEEELVDPQKELRESCSEKPDAQNLWGKYQECSDRVNSRSKTTETCEEELIDYLHVLDKCVTKDLFKRLK